ncbi:DUF4129 domain-containing protein [Paenibacillus agri]|uniref:DUF4129 domain-containing protein n=1 Tax=Paenibacillus agri TaxID=2744309 RepID=A0A850ERW3_9BACL|nr:DUF4129 domain-containing protein [Paenibacillus agri]NUU62267.1 DUF4129 domain-containing protein [Paenibacillus agri]
MKHPSWKFLQYSLMFWAHVLMELLLFLPLLMLYATYLLPEHMTPLWMILFALLSLSGVLLRSLCDIRWKQLGVSLLLGAVAGLLFSGVSLSGISLAVACLICTYLGLTTESRIGRNKTYYSGIGLYFLAAIVFPKVSQLEPWTTLLTWCGSLSVIIVLLASNSDHLRYTSLSGRTSSLPTGLRLHNRISVLLIVVAAVALASGAGRMIGGLLFSGLRQLLSWIARLLSGSEETPLQPNEPARATPEMPPAEANDPGLIAHIFNVLSYVIVAAVIAIVAFYILRWLYKNTGGLLHKAIAAVLALLMRKQPSRGNETYQDEESSVFAWEKTLQNFKQFWTTAVSGGSRDRWEHMQGNRDRVRWLYRQWLRSKQENGYEIKKHLTPQETGADAALWSAGRNRKRKGSSDTATMPEERLLDLYDQARYGQEEPTDADVAQITVFHKSKS